MNNCTPPAPICTAGGAHRTLTCAGTSQRPAVQAQALPFHCQ